jgi:hypothetical protein
MKTPVAAPHTPLPWLGLQVYLPKLPNCTHRT